MSGRQVSAIVTYGVRENGALALTRQVVFPALRTIPNDTHASLSYTFGEDAVAARLCRRQARPRSGHAVPSPRPDHDR